MDVGNELFDSRMMLVMTWESTLDPFELWPEMLSVSTALRLAVGRKAKLASQNAMGRGFYLVGGCFYELGGLGLRCPQKNSPTMYLFWVYMRAPSILQTPI